MSNENNEYRPYEEVQFSESSPKPIREANNDNPKFISLGDLLNEPDEETSWIVEGLLPSGGFSILVAKAKVGKSTLARQLALSVARGELFLDRSTTRGPVLYISLEEKRSEVKRHFNLMGSSGEELISIYVGHRPEAALEWLIATIKKVNPVLIIIDTLIRFINISDINDYAKITKALDPLLNLAREHNVHVLCLHHARKMSGDGADVTLGSTGIFGSVDTAIVLKKKEGKRTIETEQRYGTDLESTVLIFDNSTQCVTLGGTKEEEDFQHIEKLILLCLETKNKPVDEKTIEEEVEGRTGPKRRAIRELVAIGEIIRIGSGRKGDPFMYSRSLVPTINREQEKKEIKYSQNTDTTEAYSGSQDSTASEKDYEP